MAAQARGLAAAARSGAARRADRVAARGVDLGATRAAERQRGVIRDCGGTTARGAARL